MREEVSRGQSYKYKIIVKAHSAGNAWVGNGREDAWKDRQDRKFLKGPKC